MTLARWALAVAVGVAGLLVWVWALGAVFGGVEFGGLM